MRSLIARPRRRRLSIGRSQAFNPASPCVPARGVALKRVEAISAKGRPTRRIEKATADWQIVLAPHDDSKGVQKVRVAGETENSGGTGELCKGRGQSQGVDQNWFPSAKSCAGGGRREKAAGVRTCARAPTRADRRTHTGARTSTYGNSVNGTTDGRSPRALVVSGEKPQRDAEWEAEGLPGGGMEYLLDPGQ